MASSSDWTAVGIENPLLIQAAILNRFEHDTDVAIVDPNCPASVLIESFATLSAGMVRQIDDTVRPAIYAARASTTSDLYKHISDNDYVDIFGSPAQTTVMMIIDRDYAINHALPVPKLDDAGNTVRDDAGNIVYLPYNKITIPETSQFTIGEHTFGLYYPIDIRINKLNGNFSVVYDSSRTNPLHALSTNTLDYEFRWLDGRALVYIKIPVYQFKTEVHDMVLVAASGFKRSIKYEDTFYALRCRCEVLTNPDREPSEDEIWEMKELKLAMSGQTYSPTEPTVVFSPDLESNELVIEIPFIYFMKNLLRGTLNVQIYTTAGELNYTIPTDTTELVTVDMFKNVVDTTTAEFAFPFRTMPAFSTVPLETTVVGGTNGMTFAELRDRVITGTLKSKTLQTPDDIDAYFKNEGYVTTLLKDGITDRIFICHAPLRNSTNEIVGSDTIPTVFDFKDVSKYSTIMASGNDTYTILPNTLYKYDDNAGVATPVPDSERAILESLTPAELVEEFNTHVYTISPFYLQVSTTNKYPTTITYDLNNVEVVSREFIGERDDVPLQLLLNSGDISVTKINDRDGYRLTFKVGRNGIPDTLKAVITDSAGVNVKNIRVLVAMKNDDGNFYYEEGKWQGVTDDGYDLFTLDISFRYIFHQANNDHTVVLNYGRDITGQTQLATDFFLKTEARVILLLNNDVQDVGKTTTGEPWVMTDFTQQPIEDIADYTGMSEHKFVFKFGDVVDELDQRINISFKEAEYRKWEDTELAMVKTDIYQKDEYGNIAFKWLKADGSEWVPGVDAEDLKKSVTLIRKFPAGILRCLTEKINEVVSLNRFLIGRYEGKTYMTDLGAKKPIVGFRNPHEEGWYESYAGGYILSEDTECDPTKEYFVAVSHGSETQYELADYTTPPGEYAVQGSEIVPRFTVENQLLADASTSEYLNKKYEIVDPYECKAFSHSFHEWISHGQDNIMKLFTKNALLWLFEDVFDLSGTQSVFQNKLVLCPFAIDGKGGDDPLKGVTAPVSQFVLVYNDASDDPDYYVPQLTAITTAMTIFTRIYQMTKEGWICIGMGSSAYDIYQQACADANEHSSLNPDISNYPQTHGYVYLFRKWIPGAKYGQGSWGLPNKRICSLITTKTPEHHNVEVLDLACRPLRDYIIATESEPIVGTQYYTRNQDRVTKEYTYTAVTLDEGRFVDGVEYYKWSTDAAWEMEEKCKWPWDTKTWYQTVESTIRFEDGSTTDKPISADVTLKPFTFTINDALSLKFDMSVIYKHVIHTTSQYRVDADGQLVPDPKNTRHIQYLIDMTHLDAKLAWTSANQESGEYPNSIMGVMRAHFDNLGNARDNLFTNSRLFFEPTKSLGKAEFSVGDNDTEILPLDISIKFKVHVSQATADDEVLISGLKDQIVEIIDNQIELHRYLNCTEIAGTILEELKDSVEMIDVLGINGDPSLQTMKPIDPDVIPHLGHRLTLLEDGITIDVSRKLDLEIVVNS